jgi:hypothetical protein
MEWMLSIAKLGLLGFFVFAGGVLVTKLLAKLISSTSKKDENDPKNTA